MKLDPLQIMYNYIKFLNNYIKQVKRYPQSKGFFFLKHLVLIFIVTTEWVQMFQKCLITISLEPIIEIFTPQQLKH